MPYPLQPIQLSLISALTIGLPSFFLALEPNKSRLQGSFMLNVLREAFPGGLADLIIVLGLEGFAWAFAFPTQALSTLCALCVAEIGLLVLYHVCKPIDGKRRVLWGGVALALAFCVTVGGGFFSLTALDLQQTLVLAVFLVLGWSAMRGMLWVFEYCRGALRRLNHRLSGKGAAA